MATLPDANTNPWYVLMTLYGEQEGEEVDVEVFKENRNVWNTLIQQIGGTGCDRARVVITGLPSRDAWREQYKIIGNKWAKVYEERNGSKFPESFDIRSLPCDLSQLNFRNFVMLNGYFMPKGAIFDGSTFAHGIKSQAGFWGGRLSLAECVFGGDVDVQGSVFSDGVNCRSARIKGSLKLADTKMLGDLILGSVKISKSLMAERLEAECAVYCDKATIAKDADLSEVKFESSAYFDDTVFAGRASFIRTTFSQDVRFVLTKFSLGGNFSSATFNDDAVFRNTQFLGPADFPSAQFLGRADFTEAVFESPPSKNVSTVRFEGAVFKKFTSFRHCKFLSDYPDFFGATLYDRTGFTAGDDYWPSARHERCQDAKDSCAIIRHAVAKQSLPEDEHFFFRREMGFAAQIGGVWQRLPYQVFGAVSDFGQSIWRPAVGLLALWAIGGLLYTVSYAWGAFDDGQQPREILFGFGLSFANIFKFLGLQRSYFDVDFTQSLNPWLQVMGGVQTVVGFLLLLLFFLGLGLRTRFRMR
tara:strand:+ start:21426 stop:23012 length:1587 start_codon:yes stop_codon:yes gene_type:complete